MLSTLALVGCLGYTSITAKFDRGFVGVYVAYPDLSQHFYLLDTGSAKTFAFDENSPATQDAAGALPIKAPPLGRKPAHPIVVAGTPAEGILGIDSLQTALVVDYVAETVQIARSGSSSETSVPLRKNRDSLYTLDAKVDGKLLRLCLDTGASTCCISHDKASSLTPLAPSAINSFDGKRILSRFLAEHIEVGPAALSWVPMAALTWEADQDGILAPSVLSELIVIDIPAKRFAFRPRDLQSEYSRALRRVLGMPLSIREGVARFDEQTPEFFKALRGTRLVKARYATSDDILDGIAHRKSKAFVQGIFDAMREPGLITVDRDGQLQEITVRISD